jgi:ribosome maturation factor RimP
VIEESSGLPSPERVVELLSGEFARAGYEIEDVSVDPRRRPPRIRVVADGERPLDLEAVAELSRAASELLDSVHTADNAYDLEVSSPGVDRPLTAEKHYRRARGRKVEVDLADGTAITGRIGLTTGGAVDLVIRAGGGWAVRRIPLGEIRQAVVQVEFAPPSSTELELLGRTETEAEA